MREFKGRKLYNNIIISKIKYKAELTEIEKKKASIQWRVGFQKDQQGWQTFRKINWKKEININEIIFKGRHYNRCRGNSEAQKYIL